MAYPRLKGKKWYACFTDAHGKPRELVTTATSKTGCREVCREIEAKVRRQKLGLEAIPNDSGWTVKQLCEWWLEKHCKKRAEYKERKRLERYIFNRDLGAMRLGEVRPENIDDLFDDMERKDGLKGASINRLRNTLRSAFESAPESIFNLRNPVAKVDPRAVNKGIYQVLHAEEIPVLMPYVPEEWRGVVAIAIYMALRKGEILGLRKEDVDLRNKLLAVAYSYDEDTTKGGHADMLPIPDAAVPYFESALKASPSHLVFPWPDGRMRTEESDPHLVLRRALGYAGIVTGYIHSCRRCKARKDPSYKPETRQDAVKRKCATCGMVMWIKPVPRHIRFHDLRHSTATILLRQGEPAQHVQKILRHANITTTTNMYNHMVVEDIRGTINKVSRDLPGTCQTSEPAKAKGPALSKTSKKTGPLSRAGKGI